MGEQPEPTPPASAGTPPASAGTPPAQPGSTYTPPATQAELDRIIEVRLNRERAKFADYDELKRKASEFDKQANEGKSQADQLASQLAELQQKLADESHARLRAEVVASKGLTPAQAKRLSGSTLEELEADADDLLESFPSSPAGGPPSPKPRQSLSDAASGGTDPQTQEEKVDPAKLADAIPLP